MHLRTMKLLRTFFFIAVALGSTAALPAHEEEPKLNLIHFAKVKKNSVSQGGNTRLKNMYSFVSLKCLPSLLTVSLPIQMLV